MLKILNKGTPKIQLGSYTVEKAKKKVLMELFAIENAKINWNFILLKMLK